MNDEIRPEPCALGSYLDFYQTAYGQFITTMKPIGRCMATLLEVEQPAGDWSDYPSNDLVVAQNVSGPACLKFQSDVGSFSGVGRKFDFMVTPPATATRIEIDARHRIRLLAIPWKSMCTWIDSDDLRLPADGNFGSLHHFLNRDLRLTRALDQLWTLDTGTSVTSTLYADALLVQIVGNLVELARPARSPVPYGLSKRQLQNVDAFMRSRLADDIGLSELASEVGLSVAHFCRAFKQSTGTSPYQALIRLRMLHAQQLLSQGDRSIAEVTFECGYSQPAHFARHFRREVGISPSEWRSRQPLGMNTKGKVPV